MTVTQIICLIVVIISVSTVSSVTFEVFVFSTRFVLEVFSVFSVSSTISDTTAILTDVVSGKKSISEAYGELKQIRSNDFEEKIKELKNSKNQE